MMAWRSHPLWRVTLNDLDDHNREITTYINAASPPDAEDICRIRYPNYRITQLVSAEHRARPEKLASHAIETPNEERERTNFDSLLSKANGSSQEARAAALEVIEIESQHSSSFRYRVFLELAQVESDIRNQSRWEHVQQQQLALSEGESLKGMDAIGLRRFIVKLSDEALHRLMQLLAK